MISYFANHSRSQSDDDQKGFYDVIIYVPSGSEEDIVRTLAWDRGGLKIAFSFIPEGRDKYHENVLIGYRDERDVPNVENARLSADYLKYARIDVTYRLGFNGISRKQCGFFTLMRFFFLKAMGSMILEVPIQEFKSFFANARVSRRLRVPLKSKYEIYEVLMKSDDFLMSGRFDKKELETLLFGGFSGVRYKLYKQASKSLDWVLDACEKDGEIEKSHTRMTEDKPMYKITGLGVQYFTLTKERIVLEEHNKSVERKQVEMQYTMVIATIFIAIGTLYPILKDLYKKYPDKVNELKELYYSIAGALQ